MTAERRKAKVEVATDDDLREAVRRALDEAGVTLDDLREQARTSRFKSYAARRAWFVVSSVGDRIEAA